MNSAPSTLEPGNPILGVFAFLDATLAPELILEAATHDLENRHDYWSHKNLRRDVGEILQETFRLQNIRSPLRKELAKFRLYHRRDMADALSVAYFLVKRGANPIDALTADYCLTFHGILTWEDLDKIKAELTWENPRATWGHFSAFYEPGDRLVHYQTLGSCGLLLVRGDRLVWDHETIHFCSSPSLRWKTDRDHFMALGGNRGFLAGDFVWPPPDWVNPVTNEEEDEHMKKGWRLTKPLEPAP
jgi:hypothetical protein